MRLAYRVESFCIYADSHEDIAPSVVSDVEATRLLNRLRKGFLEGVARRLCTQWLAQSEAKEDIAKSTELHAHLALISSPATYIAHPSCRLKSTDASTAVASELVASNIEAKTLLSSAAYVVSWHPKLPATESTSGGSRRNQAEKVAKSTVSVPVHDVFVMIQQRRMALLRWSERAAQAILDSQLGRVVECALQRTNIAASDLIQDVPLDAGSEVAETFTTKWKGWKLVSEKPMMCLQTVESSHPYTPSTDCQWSVSFPGAEYVIISFEHCSVTQKNEDYVSIYKDSSLTENWGQLADHKLSGMANSGWPGSGGRPPLVIPSDRFVIHFHSGPGRGKPCEWGFKLNAVAPVCLSSSRKLKVRFVLL